MTFILGWITLFVGDVGEGALCRGDEVDVKQRNLKNWLWAPLGARHQDELADRP
jgi:hypothetical protein